MSRQTEKIFNDFNQFVRENDIEIENKDKLNKILDEFMADYQYDGNDTDSADYYLELAESANTKGNTAQLAKEAKK